MDVLIKIQVVTNFKINSFGEKKIPNKSRKEYERKIKVRSKKLGYHQVDKNTLNFEIYKIIIITFCDKTIFILHIKIII